MKHLDGDLNMDFGAWIAIGASWGMVWWAAKMVRKSVREQELNKIWSHATSGGLGLWWLAVVVAAWSGWFQATPDTLFPRILVGWIPGLAVLGVWLVSPEARRLVTGLPRAGLVGVQSLRLVGLATLWSAWVGMSPPVFAVPAGLCGVIVGATAPFVAYAIASGLPDSVRLARRWNVLGLFDIALAMVLGGLCGPGVNQVLSLEFPNTVATAFPLAVVPAFVVPIALLGHMCSLRSLARDS